jgi:hypothetical protein
MSVAALNPWAVLLLLLTAPRRRNNVGVGPEPSKLEKRDSQRDRNELDCAARRTRAFCGQLLNRALGNLSIARNEVNALSAKPVDANQACTLGRCDGATVLSLRQIDIVPCDKHPYPHAIAPYSCMNAVPHIGARQRDGA